MSKMIKNRKIMSSMVFNYFYDGKRNKLKVGVSPLLDCMKFLVCITVSIWNFFHVIIVLKNISAKTH